MCPEGGEAGEGVWGFERVSPARLGRHAWRPRVAGGGAGSTLAAFSSSEQAPKFTN
ncbi:SipW-dependent-type signal peptide-containing protein [Enterobacter hormaechei subsp. xiangfangensis]|uniref:SipW-dependent-type signal peptide-containing protein n=1 Tax=Enterobacter cloacae complex TaxID=354276 RepID=UPI0033077F83